MRIAIMFLGWLLSSAAARAEFDVFLQVTPQSGPLIAGTTADPIYSGWSEVLAFESGAARPIAIGSGTPTTGPVAFREFTIVKKVDAATGFFSEKLTAGGNLATVRIVVAQRGPARVELWDMMATTCAFTKQEFTCATGEDLIERITLAAATIEWSHITVAPSGDALNEFFANWSLLTNSGASGSRSPSSAGDVDSDSDGIPNGWEAFYGLNKNLLDSGLDTDGDGLTNLQEYAAHTDPKKSQSVLRVSALQPTGPGTYRLTWQSVVGLNYRILTATSPAGPYTFLKNVASAGNGSTSTTVTAPSARFFYRVATP